MNKKFDLGTVLSITTSVLLTDIGNVYEILNYMTGDDIYTHQIPRALDECAPAILKQFPQLQEIDTESVGEENWNEFLSDNVKKYGNEFEIKPLDVSEHQFINPLTELNDMIE